jgi:excisionase family DNA binding protein
MTVARTLTGLHELWARSADEQKLVAELDRALGHISNANPIIQIRIQAKDQPEEMIPISPEHFRVLAHILGELARGHGVSLVPMEAELTTNEAARQLKVSRPFLIGLLEKGEIPYRRVGSHRRIRYRDLMAYKQGVDRGRLQALEDLAALDQEYRLRDSS